MVYLFLYRFCLFETSCAQSDNFPSNLCVKVNGKLCPLPVSTVGKINLLTYQIYLFN